jgi:hypothetical protein
VPQAILNALGDNDASIFVAVSGLMANSAVTGTVLVREANRAAEGVFVQTFDENGVAIGGAELLDGAAPYDDEDGMVSLISTSDGGFAAQWVVTRPVTAMAIRTQSSAIDGSGNKVGSSSCCTTCPRL